MMFKLKRNKSLLVVILSLVWTSVVLHAQERSGSSQSICFELLFGSHNLDLTSSPFVSNDYTIETLKFYVGNINLFNQGEIVWKDEINYHLIDATDSSSLCIASTIKEDLDFDEVRFLLGIDSVTSASGVFGNDLDPTNGMYWAWHSGYINFKLEGNKTLSDNTKQKFQFHLGGYLDPYFSAQQIALPLKNASLNIRLNTKSFLDQIDLLEINTVMSPNATAMDLSSILPTSISTDE